ncbi:TPM domain-containing protein [Comamonas sp. lk]|uniref:TPM domain-containing protein n=1 Tax=Comamonas sp. lk TaxID=2201272 RepID=UPI000EB2B371|nr:TPM domain-containing protein [Comamonas sp. lk]
MSTIFHRLARLVRHRWAERQLNQALPVAVLAELEQLIAQSELRHTGQVRICVEAGLPWSYIWGHATPRQRALSLFSKLRVWDTEHNNGVLIYLLMADHAIEIVADRALHRTMGQEQWQTLISDMRSAFQGGHYAVGLRGALERVSRQLEERFPRLPGKRDTTHDELPDMPVVERHLPGR